MARLSGIFCNILVVCKLVKNRPGFVETKFHYSVRKKLSQTILWASWIHCIPNLFLVNYILKFCSHKIRVSRHSTSFFKSRSYACVIYVFVSSSLIRSVYLINSTHREVHNYAVYFMLHWIIWPTFSIWISSNLRSVCLPTLHPFIKNRWYQGMVWYFGP